MANWLAWKRAGSNGRFDRLNIWSEPVRPLKNGLAVCLPKVCPQSIEIKAASAIPKPLHEIPRMQRSQFFRLHLVKPQPHQLRIPPIGHILHELLHTPSAARNGFWRE